MSHPYPRSPSPSPANGVVWVQETEVEFDRLIPLLVAVSDRNPDIRIFVRGDRTIAYGRVLEIVGAINAAGFQRVALVSTTPSFGNDN